MLSPAREVANPSSAGGYVWIIYGLLVLHAVCFQLQVPLEPYLVDHLMGKGNEATATYGHLQSFYQLMALVGSVAFGGFLDRYGCRTGLIVSHLACALQFLLLANTSSVPMLFLSKVPGLLSHPFLSCQTAVSQLAPEGPERVAAFGRLVTAYTAGGIIGPYAGGLLGARGNYFLSAKLAVVGSLVPAVVCCYLPVDLEQCAGRGGAGGGGGDAPPLADEAGRRGGDAAEAPRLPPWTERAGTIFRFAGPLIMLRFLINTVNGMTKSADTVVMKNEFHLAQADLGFIMSVQFAFMSLNSGVLLGPVTRLLGGNVRPVVAKCLPITAALFFVQA